MLRQSLLITALCVSSISFTGCSTATTAWNSTGDLVNGVASLFLRGSPDKSDVKFVEADSQTEQGIYKTDIGEYVPLNPQTAQVEIYDAALSGVNSGAVPCPEGTYLTADNNCMSMESETFDFADNDVGAQFVDTGPVPCPEGTYLNAKNTCEYLEVEQFEFADDVNMTEQFIDTSPVPCPEGTYLNAENTCMFLEVEDFAAELNSDDTARLGFVQNTSAELTASP